LGFLEVRNVENFYKRNIYTKGRPLVADRIMVSKILQFKDFYQCVTIFFWIAQNPADRSKYYGKIKKQIIKIGWECLVFPVKCA